MCRKMAVERVEQAADLIKSRAVCGSIRAIVVDIVMLAPETGTICLERREDKKRRGYDANNQFDESCFHIWA